MKYFDGVQNIIEAYSGDKLIPLDDCPKTIDCFFNEKVANNPYRKLAERFRIFNIIYLKNNNLDCINNCECEDKLFYLHLRNKCKQEDQYEFPLRNGKFVNARVDIFNPYVKLKDGREMVNPQWHLIVSYYAYIDAAFNHPENTELLKLTGWTSKPIKKKLSNKTNIIWMQEANKEFYNCTFNV